MYEAPSELDPPAHYSTSILKRDSEKKKLQPERKLRILRRRLFMDLPLFYGAE